MTLETLLAAPQYSLAAPAKTPALLAALNALTRHHYDHSPEYRRIVDVIHGGETTAATLADVPFLPIGMFKRHRLASIPQEEVFTTLWSSGTTGQTPSQVVLDRETASRQSTGLASIMTSVLGAERLPMGVIDTRDLLRNRHTFTARGAGVLGMMNFGRQHVFLLDEQMQLDRAALDEFLKRLGGKPFLLFGFTFMVWEYFFRQIEHAGYDLSQGILVHSGGWKKLQDQAVSNETFRARFRGATGLRRIYNFYGTVEQVGGVFLEGDDGHLYAPNFADVIIRDPATWKEAPHGAPGVIQLLSALPRSYPGHSILTEDLGVIHGVDDGHGGRRGKHFSVIGRVPKAELRGCSDTHQGAVAAR